MYLQGYSKRGWALQSNHHACQMIDAELVMTDEENGMIHDGKSVWLLKWPDIESDWEIVRMLLNTGM